MPIASRRCKALDRTVKAEERESSGDSYCSLVSGGGNALRIAFSQDARLVLSRMHVLHCLHLLRLSGVRA